MNKKETVLLNDSGQSEAEKTTRQSAEIGSGIASWMKAAGWRSGRPLFTGWGA